MKNLIRTILAAAITLLLVSNLGCGEGYSSECDLVRANMTVTSVEDSQDHDLDFSTCGFGGNDLIGAQDRWMIAFDEEFQIFLSDDPELAVQPWPANALIIGDISDTTIDAYSLDAEQAAFFVRVEQLDEEVGTTGGGTIDFSGAFPEAPDEETRVTLFFEDVPLENDLTISGDMEVNLSYIGPDE